MTTYIVLVSSILISGFLMVFVLNTTVKALVRKKIKPDESPVSVDIIKAVLFTMGSLLISEAVVSFQTVNKVLSESFKGNDLILKQITYASIFIFIILVMIFMILGISIMLYSLITKGRNIILEAVNNDYNAIIVYIGIVVSFTLVLKEVLNPLLDCFIPYPNIPFYN